MTDPQPARRPLTRWLILALEIALSLGLLAFVLTKVPLSDADRLAHRLGTAGTGAFLLLFSVQVAVVGLRWRWIAHSIGIALSHMRALRMTALANLVNQAGLSVIAGDGLRVLMLLREGVSTRKALHSLIIDRAIALGALVLLCDLALLFATAQLRGAREWQAFSVILLALNVAAAGALIAVYLQAERHRLVAGPLAALAPLSADTWQLLRRPALLIGTIGSAVLIHAINLVIIAAVLRILGFPLGAAAIVTAGAPVLLAASLPFSINGWGVREAGLIWTLSFAGVPAETALLAALTIGIGQLVAACICAALAILPGHRPAD